MANNRKADEIPLPEPTPVEAVSDKVKKSKRFRQKQRLFITIFVLISAAVLAFPRLTNKYIPEFNASAAKLYMQKIFPVITTPFAWLNEKIPFSFGELLIILALILIPLSLIIVIVVSVLKAPSKDVKRGVRRFFAYFWAWVLTYVLVSETFCCYALYPAPTFTELYPEFLGETYTAGELEQLADFLIFETNQLSTKVQRDEKGQFVLTADLDETAKAAMKNLSEEFPQLKGYYTTPKPIKNSFFMSQQYLTGIYFPFTIEANYNDQMYAVNMPETICHELSHTKGFIREDEANILAFLACYKSDNNDYRYSGCLSALRYVLGKCDEHCSDETKNRLYSSLADGVRIDWNANSEYWASVQKSDEGLFKSETVAEVSDKAMEASLQFGGVEDGKRSYGRMVDLLLDWYYHVK